jgi:hypothetical protein
MAESRKPYLTYLDPNLQELFERLSISPSSTGKCRNFDALILNINLSPGWNSIRHNLGRVPNCCLVLAQDTHPCKIETGLSGLAKETVSLWAEYSVTARVWLI